MTLSTSKESSAGTKRYFEGLNALRFIAAFLVLIMHVKGFFIRNIDPSFADLPILRKGHTAVSFFFTLSGFLITYQMLEEAATEGKVAVRNFYRKRVRRIWPLYFLVIAIGVALYFIILPALGSKTKDDFNIPLVLFFYAFFMPNVPSSFWNIGSILGITWSIGVEEQFYLFWAPLFNFFRKRLLAFFVSMFVLFALVQVVNYHFVSNVPLRALLYTFQFHNMAIGAIAAYFYFRYSSFVDSSFFLSKPFQFVVFFILVGFLFFTDFDHYNAYYGILISLLYVYIILSCAIPRKSIFKTTWKPLDYCGKISYGIYMYHSVCIYIASIFVNKMKGHFSSSAQLIVFSLSCFILTLALSAASYEYFEKRFLTRKKIAATAFANG